MLRIRKYKLKKLMINLSIFLITTIIILLLSEMVLRFIEYTNQGSIIHFPNAIMPSEDPELYFELVPNLKNQRFYDTVININSDGLRDKEYNVEKPPNTIRIAAFGDSVGFGWGVNLEEIYTEVLERNLNENFKNKNYEVINFGVPGYYTTQELRMLELKALKYKPDIIILIYLFNDAEVKIFHKYDNLTFLYRKLNFFLKRKSYLHYFLSTKFAETRAKLNEKKFLENSTEKNYGNLLGYQFSEDSIGWNMSKESLLKMNQLSKENNAKFILFLWPDVQDLKNYQYLELHEIILNFCKENNLSCVDLLEDYKKYANMPLGTGPEKKDAHPDKLGHEIMANAIYRKLVEDNLV